MASILLRTISSVDDKRIVLGNEQIARLLEIADNWTKLRIGLLWSINASATVSSSPRFAIGVCNGTANLYGSASTNHFVGVFPNISSFSYTSGPPAYLLTSVVKPRKRVGTTNTDSGSGIISPYMSAAPASIRSAFYLDIEKGSPNYTFQVGAPDTTGAAQTDITWAKFLEGMEIGMADMGSWTTGYADGNAQTVAVDEDADGVLNALNIYWNRDSPTIEVSGLAYARLEA